MKFSRRSLLLILLITLLCFSTVTGTIAWFTDTVSFSGNTVASGTPDAGLYWAEYYAGMDLITQCFVEALRENDLK